MKKFIPNQFEEKWRQKWSENRLYSTDLSKPEKKYYVLAEFSYPSGDLHMGHWFTFALPDILARYKRMQGFNVLFPNGFDAFGLPAENAAIKRDIHPQDWTLSNIERMKAQFATMGATFDWDKSVITCLPEYYHWNQWIFLKMLEKGLAYRGKLLSNWCPSCQTVLANENVEAGKCWRCGFEVEQKEIEQWFLKITAYADRLIWPASPAQRGEPQSPTADWPKPLKEGQNNWIGRSEGTLIKFKIKSDPFDFTEGHPEQGRTDEKLKVNNDIVVFTTRPDTIFGATFLVISPEYPLLTKLITQKQEKEVKEYIAKAKKKSELERKESKEKTGVFTGSHVVNPLTKQVIPVWVADYVLSGYGTGAIMAVPAHDQRDFEFAKKFGLEIVQVIETDDPNILDSLAYEGDGVTVNSGEFNGLSSTEAKERITEHLIKHQLGEKKITYHLHDWSISRQRYWGTPIPVIYCDKCGIVPVPEEDLPVVLPYKVDYAPLGKAPLATAEEWVNVDCPSCKGKAKREVETMDTFIDSSWYFFRYLDPHNSKEIFDKEVVGSWTPVDIYFGGPEHTFGHALYSRFFTKFLADLNLINFDEYALKRVHHGLILGTDGSRMSKSRGNVVNPDEEVKQYGADAVRIYLAFLGPIDIVAPWDPNGINGVYHFLERVWGLADKMDQQIGQLSAKDLFEMHKTVRKVGEDISSLKFNTAIAALMEWLNYLSRKELITREEYKIFLQLLAPFAPFTTEELWEIIGEKYSVHQQSWPEFDKRYLEKEEFKVAVQVNGRVREMLLIQKDIISDKEVVEKMALESLKVQKFLSGQKIEKVIYVPGKIINFVTK